VKEAVREGGWVGEHAKEGAFICIVDLTSQMEKRYIWVVGGAAADSLGSTPERHRRLYCRQKVKQS